MGASAMSAPKPPPGFELVQDAPPPPPGFEIVGPTLGQKAQSSVIGRIYKGAKDGVDAMAQLAPRVLEAATEFGGPMSPILKAAGIDTSNPVSRFLGGEAKRVDTMVAGDEKEYEASRAATGSEGFDGARLVGNIVSPSNVVPARVVGPLKSGVKSLSEMLKFGAKAGGAGAVLTSPVTDEKSQAEFGQAKGIQATLGTVAGSVLTPVIGKAADAIVRKVDSVRGSEMTLAQRSLETDKIIETALREIESSSAEVPPQMLQGIRQQVNDALRTGKKLDAAALFRKEEFEKLGMEPMLGQITRDPTQFANERNLRGADPRVAARLNEQSRKMGELLRNFGGKNADEPTVAGGNLITHLSDLDKQGGKLVSDEYKIARESAGRDMEIPVTGLAQDAAKIVRDFGSKLPDAVKSRLDEFGVFSGKPQKMLTINEAEDVLQQLNNLRGNDRATNTALGEVTKAVKKAILEADDQGGVFAKPRDLAAQRFTLQRLVPALKAAAEGDASADKFVGQFVLRGETAEVQKLAQLLKGTNPELFEQTRNQFGAEIMRAAYGENAAGDKVIRPESLAKALRQFGPERLKAFFSQGEIEQMNRLARVAAYAESIPAGSPVNTSNSFTAALPFLARIPVVGTGVQVADVLRRTMQKESTARAGLTAAVPNSNAELSPEAARTLANLLSTGGVLSGSLGAQAIR